MIISEEDEVGTYAFLVHKRLSNPLQSVSIPLTTSVSIFPHHHIQSANILSIDYAVAFWALHRLGAIST